jgi:hypothetical protein
MTQSAIANPITAVAEAGPTIVAAPAPAPVPAHTSGHPSIVVQVAADNAMAARLIHPRAEVASALRVAVEKGAEIHARRIRYQEDLDEARLAKLKWTQAVVDLLTALFDTSAVADYCNDWVGKIFPEYAAFGNFVEQFYEEMEYRLTKLRAVLERVEQVPDPVARPIVSDVAHSNTVAPRIAAVEGNAPAGAPTPAVRPVPTSHVMIFGAATTDPAYGAVAALLERLGVGAHPTSDPLSAGAADAAVFVAPSQPSDATTQQPRVALFQLGYAVGRLGADRVCVLHAEGAPLCPESKIPHIPADAGGGWQLQLARQLKQAGLNVDLNKLC